MTLSFEYTVRTISLNDWPAGGLPEVRPAHGGPVEDGDLGQVLQRLPLPLYVLKMFFGIFFKLNNEWSFAQHANHLHMFEDKR